jgi:hypothetical protein
MKAIDVLAARFDELDLARLRPEPKPFIYFLAYDDEIVYVGQTLDVQARVRIHLQDKRICGPKEFNRVFFVEVDESDLDAYEGALIRALNPKYSLRAPRDRGRDDEVLAIFGIDRDANGAFEARQRASYLLAHPRKS